MDLKTLYEELKEFVENYERFYSADGRKMSAYDQGRVYQAKRVMAMISGEDDE